MCTTDPQACAGTSPASPVPHDAGQALAFVRAGLDYLAAADPTALTGGEQADVLRGLAGCESVQLAASASVLAAFDRQVGYAADGQMTSKAWLRWQARITNAAAGAATGWARRLAAHPRVRAALAAALISPSWARHLCAWTDTLPEDSRDGADKNLLNAAAGGAELSDLAALFEQIRDLCARPDPDHDGDDSFAQRRLRLTRHYQGHAHLDGDLTPPAAAALEAVLDALGGRAGPEDLRSAEQRHHDALEEACRQLTAAGNLPDRAGQPTQIQLHLTLSQLLGQPEAEPALAAWITANGGAAPPGADCDAAITPIVTGTLDPGILDQAAATILGQPADSTIGMADRAPARHLAISRAIKLLSGPAGLAAWLRTDTLTGPAASISLPLDVGKPTDTIPPHLRRAIIRRDQHCRFPGCERRAAACHVHHLVPRSEGGVTSLDNCCLSCPFHHLVAIHRWGWTLVLNPDGTTTATLGDTILHSHTPPIAA